MTYEIGKEYGDRNCEAREIDLPNRFALLMNVSDVLVRHAAKVCRQSPCRTYRTGIAQTVGGAIWRRSRDDGEHDRCEQG